MTYPTASAREAPSYVSHVTLAVRDLPTVAVFYRDVIGFAVLSQDEHRVALGCGGHMLLTLVAEPGGARDDPASAGLFHIAFLFPGRVDLGRWLRHATAIGLTLDGAADHLVSEAVYLHDPEGNGIELTADRPRSAWRWSEGQVAMANARLDLTGLMSIDDSPWTGAPPGTVIGHVHLRVGEMATAADFFAGTLGMTLTRGLPQAAFMSSGGYHHHLAGNVWQSAGAGRRDPAVAGLREVALHASDSRAAGVFEDPWGTRFVVA